MAVDKVKINKTCYNVELGGWANRATASVRIWSDRLDLVTVVDSLETTGNEGGQLSVDFRVKASAVGRIPSNFLKRETRPSDAEILMSRLIDRSIRPHLSQSRDSRLVVSVLVLGASADACLFEASLLGTSLALKNARADFPIILGQTINSPAGVELKIAVQKDGLIMAEGQFEQVSMPALAQCIAQHTETLALTCAALDSNYPVQPASSQSIEAGPHESFFEQVWSCPDIDVRRCMLEKHATEYNNTLSDIHRHWSVFVRAKASLGLRQDGREAEEIRPIDIRADLSGSAHGLIRFQRGLTTALVFASLGSSRDQQDVPSLLHESTKDRLIVHYNFLPFSTHLAEIGRSMPNRREIGHGQLIKKALSAVFPNQESFPFSLRINSEILAADGSSSMASVVGASLAMAQAGVPLEGPVGGISVGRFPHATGHNFFLDLTEDEDHASDFDLKVTGTRKGITALQLDIKAKHLDVNNVTEALAVASRGLDKIIDGITQDWILCNRLNDYLERPSTTMFIRQCDVGRVIGGGGKNLKALQADTNCRVEISKTGFVAVTAPDTASLRHCVHRLSNQSLELECGRLYIASIESQHEDVWRLKVDSFHGYAFVPEQEPLTTKHVLAQYLGKDGEGHYRFEILTKEVNAEQAMNFSSR